MTEGRNEKSRGPALVWVASGLTFLAGMLYLVAADPHAGEGGAVLAMGGSLLVSGLASAAAGWTSNRRGAMWLLIVALIPLVVMGVLALLSIGILFLAVAGLLFAGLLQTLERRTTTSVT